LNEIQTRKIFFEIYQYISLTDQKDCHEQDEIWENKVESESDHNHQIEKSRMWNSQKLRLTIFRLRKSLQENIAHFVCEIVHTRWNEIRNHWRKNRFTYRKDVDHFCRINKFKFENAFSHRHQRKWKTLAHKFHFSCFLFLDFAAVSRFIFFNFWSFEWYR
jgi:hypothetical protein